MDGLECLLFVIDINLVNHCKCIIIMVYITQQRINECKAQRKIFPNTSSRACVVVHDE